jgi:head-tail adaptor
MQSSFIDSRMLDQLVAAGHFPQLCTIQEATETLDTHRQVMKTWTPVTGMTDIPCSVALSSGREVNSKEIQYGVTTHRISLAGTYAVTRLQRAIVGMVTYEIQFVNPSGFTNSVTVLECVVVT